jgi:lipopolysaccharide export system ATP-binding protein
MPLLDVRGLEKKFGPRKVVDGVSFTVSAGEVVGLLGPNGAGKTTSFRMTTGQIVPNAGAVLFAGEDVSQLPMYQRARRGMGYLSQEPSIFRKLSVEKNLVAILEALPRSRSLGRKLSRSERWDRVDKALAQFNLTHVRKNPAARCSGGEKRRLEIARCLVCEPLLILLDEPFAAVDPLTTEDIRHNIRDLAKQGIGILLTDHNVREVLKITDRSYLIKDGKVVVHGSPEQIKRDPVAIREYLGNTFADDPIAQVFRDEPRPVQPPIAEPRANSVVPSSAEVILSIVNTEPDPEPDPPAPPPRPNTPPERKTAPKPPMASAPPAAAATPVVFNEYVAPIAPATPSGGQFSANARELLEGEKMRRLVDNLSDDHLWQDAWHDLTMKGLAAVPALLDGLERRDLKTRHLAFRLLEQVTGESLAFVADAPDEIRLRQAAFLRARFDRRKAG